MMKIVHKLPAMPGVADLIRLYGLSAQQKLSQNFLLDLNLTDKMVKSAGDLTGKTVIEIGPGPGGLTRSILKTGAKKLIVIEKDARFLPALESIQQAVPKGRMHIVNTDILACDEAEIVKRIKRFDRESSIELNGEKFALIGNLPFNIGTPLLLKWLYQIERKEGLFAFDSVPMVLLLQKEVAKRIAAKVGDSDFSRLSVMTQRSCHAKTIFDIPGSAFVPPPKVETTVIKIEPRPNGPQFYPDVPLDKVEILLKGLFENRRKCISNSIKNLPESAHSILEGQIIVDPRSRPQNLTIEQWSYLAHRWWSKHQ